MKLKATLDNPKMRVNEKTGTKKLTFDCAVYLDNVLLVALMGCQVWKGFINGPASSGRKGYYLTAEFGVQLYAELMQQVEELPEYQEALQNGDLLPLEPLETHPKYKGFFLKMELSGSEAA
jgi:hypothetical protein